MYINMVINDNKRNTQKKCVTKILSCFFFYILDNGISETGLCTKVTCLAPVVTTSVGSSGIGEFCLPVYMLFPECLSEQHTLDTHWYEVGTQWSLKFHFFFWPKYWFIVKIYNFWLWHSNISSASPGIPPAFI